MSDEFSPGSVPGNPSGFIAGAVNDGTSATDALNAFREAGGSIRTQTWYRLFGEVTDSLARSPMAAALDPYQLPDPAAYATWTMGPGGQYATQVQVFFRDIDTGLIGTSQYTYVTDEPHTPAEAEAAAYDEYSDTDNAGDYGQVVLGTSTVNVYTTSPYGG